MSGFKEVIEFLTTISVGFTFVQIYLQVNKIWKRKHDREVADSQSIAGLALLFVNCIIWILYYIYVEPDFKSILDQAPYLFQAFIFIFISTGFFVRTNDKVSLWELAKRALRLERKEANYLIKKFLKPSNAEIIINILHQIAMIDDNLDPKEEELIQAFAKEWKIEYSAEKLNLSRLETKEHNFIRLRKSLEDYLATEPQREQAAQLRDMIQALIQVDDEIAPEEELIASELMGLIAGYLTGDNEVKKYEVLIVPQRNEHDEFVHTLIPNAKKYDIAGGTAYTMGTFYSHKYAEMICSQYREVNLFTIVHSDSISSSK